MCVRADITVVSGVHFIFLSRVEACILFILEAILSRCSQYSLTVMRKFCVYIDIILAALLFACIKLDPAICVQIVLIYISAVLQPCKRSGLTLLPFPQFRSSRQGLGAFCLRLFQGHCLSGSPFKLKE